MTLEGTTDTIQQTSCDYCGGEFKFPDTAKTDAWGRLYSVPGGYYFPFECPHCGKFFCAEHRLPENHNCKRMPSYAKYTPIPIQDAYGSEFANPPKPKLELQPQQKPKESGMIGKKVRSLLATASYLMAFIAMLGTIAGLCIFFRIIII